MEWRPRAKLSRRKRRGKLEDLKSWAENTYLVAGWCLDVWGNWQDVGRLRELEEEALRLKPEEVLGCKLDSWRDKYGYTAADLEGIYGAIKILKPLHIMTQKEKFVAYDK